MAKILIAEDEHGIREGLRVLLEAAGYEVVEASNGLEALEVYRAESPDLLLLDVMMPRKSGYEVCSEIRKSDPGLPIMMLSALSEERDKVLGLGLGADDFIVKPFAEKTAELLARIASALRRTESFAAEIKAAESKSVTFRIGEAVVDPARMTLSISPKKGDLVAISVRELGILKLFNSHPDEVLSRDFFLGVLWGARYMGTTRTLDQHISNLRKKLGKENGALIETVSGAGYRYRKR